MDIKNAVHICSGLFVDCLFHKNVNTERSGTSYLSYYHVFSARTWLTHSCSGLCLIAQSCPNLCDSMDCSPPGSSVHGDSPGKSAGVGCISSSRGSFEPKSPSRRILYHLDHWMPFDTFSQIHYYNSLALLPFTILIELLENSYYVGYFYFY